MPAFPSHTFSAKRSGSTKSLVPGTPLGLFAVNVPSYESREIVFEHRAVIRGDRTDPVRAHDDDIAELRYEELRKTLEELSGRDGETIIEEAFKRALAFGNNEPLPDDVLLVAMTRA